MAHSELSPSNCYRWWNCPGSVALARTCPKSEQSSYAAEGTVAHSVLERALKHGANPWEMIGMEIDGFEVTEEMAEAVGFTVDLVKAELQKGGHPLYETKVNIREGIFGTLDIAIVRPFDRIVVIDFKYGKGVLVKAEDNYQLILYLIGLLKQYECDTAELVISQPRVFTEDRVSRWECTREYVENFERELDRRIELTKEKDAVLQSGSWCGFCPAKAVCPALRGELGRALAPVKGGEVIFPDAKLLPVDTLAKILDHKDLLEKWLEAVAAHAQSILESGGAVPGYQLSKKRANRRWKSEEEVAQKFVELGDKIFNIKLLSPAQLEKIVGKEAVEGLTETPDNGITIKKVGKK